MSLALYRKYRPGSFAEVVGQDHVTEPLMQALRSGRIHHAYLFSGPRGCGKTSSARILARSLNCERGPTPTPCGVCDSCVALAPNGPGSLDVIEIDAASHGLVDDARDLRDRAFFAPVSSRFKIYIVDEAHMITSAAFNALLKVVEEPPPHVKFVFATTEPEKVLTTIRSRTFHYRFRLIPPAVMREHLADLSAREGITVDPLVLPLVVRAGGGSARDAQSILDQLAAGAGEDGITYAGALSLLGFTDAALLDEVVDAFAAGDGAAVFRAVDKVMEAGLDARRFAQDLLERLRDLVVLDAVPDAADSGLLDCPADVLERMRGQAARAGAASLTRAADVMAAALVDMRGTTSPRLVLELACSRILLPGAASDVPALLSRLDRLERRLSVTGTPDAGSPPPVSPVSPPPPTQEPEVEATPPAAAAVAAAQGTTPADDAGSDPVVDVGRDAATPAVRADGPAQTPVGSFDAAALRRLWDDLLDRVKTRSRVAAMILGQYATVADVTPRAVVLAFSPPTIARQFDDAKVEVVREALREMVGVDLQITTASTPGGPAATGETPAVAAGGTAGREPPQPASPHHDLDARAPDPDELAGDGATDGATRRDPETAAIELLESGLGATVIGGVDPSA